VVTHRGTLTCTLILDEVDKVRVEPTSDGNSREAKANLQDSLLGLLDGQPILPDNGGDQTLDTAPLLIVGAGAFGGRFTDRSPSTQDLVDWGYSPELAARWTIRYTLQPPDGRASIELFRRSERAPATRLEPLLDALGVRLVVSEPALAFAADQWFRLGADFRTAAEWLVTAARAKLVASLASGSTEEIVINPDDLELRPVHPLNSGNGETERERERERKRDRKRQSGTESMVMASEGQAHDSLAARLGATSTPCRP
jgi:hypothetical protein